MEKKLLSSLSRLVGGGPKAIDFDQVNLPDAEPADVYPKDTSSKIAYLSGMRIFRDLAPAEMKMIEKATVMATVHKGKLIYTPGETGEVLFLLKKGSVHLYRLSSKGRKLIIQTIGPMTFFGEMASVGQNMYDLFAEAAEDCLVCVMGRADVEQLILTKPQVALRMLEEIGQRMHEIQEQFGDCVFKGVPARVATLLLRLSRDGKQPITGMRHQDLADMIGIYRETVTTALDHLRDAGLISISRKGIAILNPEQLREVAEEEILRER